MPRHDSSCNHIRALRQQFKDNLVGMVIAMKGGPCTGKTTVARALAKSFRCTLISQEEILSSTTDSPLFLPSCPAASSIPALPSNYSNELSYEVLWRVAETQLRRHHSVIIDSPLPSLAHLDRLLELTSIKVNDQFMKTDIMPIIIECQPQDKSEWRRRLGKTYSLEEIERILGEDNYDTGDIPKLTLDTTSHLGMEERLANTESFILSCLDKELYGEMPLEEMASGCTDCMMAYVRKVTADLPKSFKHQCHEHELTLVTCERSYAYGKTYRFPCNGCGGTGENVHYSCIGNSCKFWLHAKCALNLPLTANPEFHWHPLLLTYRPLDPFHYCDFCEERRDPNDWIYYCDECEYHVHVSCADPEFYKSPDIVRLGTQ